MVKGRKLGVKVPEHFSMAELPLFVEQRNDGDSIELSEIESLCTNCEQNVSFLMNYRHA